MDAATYISTFPDSAVAAPQILATPEFRRSILQEMHPTPSLELLPLVRKLLPLEVAYRADESNDGEFFENLYWAALFLYQIGTLDDVIPMWKAKRTNCDTGFGFDIQFLVGQGVDETIAYCCGLNTQNAQAAADYIAECKDCGDFDYLDEWLAFWIDYYSNTAA